MTGTERPHFWKALHAIRREDLEDLEGLQRRRVHSARIQAVGRVEEPRVACHRALRDGQRKCFRRPACVRCGNRCCNRSPRTFDGLPEKDIRKWAGKVREAAYAIDPPVRVDLQYVAVDGGDVLVAEVRPSRDGPHQIQGKYHYRTTDGTRHMSHAIVRSAMERGRSEQQNAPLPAGIFTTNHYSENHGIYLGLALQPSYSDVPLLEPWDTEGRRTIENLFEDVGWKITEARPTGLLADGHPDSGRRELWFNGLVWEVLPLVEPDGPRRPREKISLPEVRNLLDRMMRQQARVLAGIQPALQVKVRARIWALKDQPAPLRIFPDPEEASRVEHYEGFRQYQLPVEGIPLYPEDVRVEELATSDEFRDVLSRRFAAQVPLYCHVVRRRVK